MALKKYIKPVGRAKFIGAMLLLCLSNLLIFRSLSYLIPSTLSFIFELAYLIAAFYFMIGRYHDQNRTGWWLLLLAIPFIGPIIVFCQLLFCKTERINNPYQNIGRKE